MLEKIKEILGKENEALLSYECKTISKNNLHLPGPDFIDRVWKDSDRSPNVLRNLQSIFNTGRLSKTGYLSILPVDQGIEHSAGASFAPNPVYFDPENIVRLAIEGGCNAVASTLGVLGSVSRKYAYKIPFENTFPRKDIALSDDEFKKLQTFIGDFGEGIFRIICAYFSFQKRKGGSDLLAQGRVKD